jgi:RNA polymerase sigma-70 factor (ECF subfamily)
MATAPDVHWESWRRLRDPASFEALVRPELGRAFAFARSLGCSEADAEDVLQESLVRLAAERSDRPSRVGVRAWLYRTVRDRARSRRRSWWRRRAREARAARPEAAPARTGDLEVREQVEVALAALPDAEREAVRLRYLQDLDYRDMAHVLGVSENACRTRVHRALESLKKRFGEGAATMVAALPVPAPTHFDHLLHEVLQGVVQAAGKATIAVGWKVAGVAAVVAGAAILAMPDEDVRRPLIRNPVSLPTTVVGVARPSTERTEPPGETPAAGRPAEPTVPPPKTATVADAVALLEEVASIGWDFGLRTSAAEVYGMILRINPDHKVAAARVGTDEEDSTKAEDGRKSFDERLEKASVEAARILSGLGTPQERWRLALEVHDQDPVANEGLRSRRISGRWISARRAAHLEFEKGRMKSSLFPRSYRVRDTDRTTGIPGKAGLSVMRSASDNFLVEADLPGWQVTEFLEQLEAVRGGLRELLQVDSGPLARKSGITEFVLLSAPDFYERAVDASDLGTSEARAAAKRRAYCKCGPDRVLALVPDGMPPARLLLHAEFHDLVAEAFLDPWVAEALANLVLCPVLGSGLTLCPELPDVPDSGASGPFLPEKAPAYLRSLVLRRRDMPMETIVALPAEGLTMAALVKSWSVLLFLLETDRRAVREFLEDAAKEKMGKRGGAEKALARNFRELRTWKDLDAAWRAWVLDVYRP